jgi:hypothetical protein
MAGAPVRPQPGTTRGTPSLIYLPYPSSVFYAPPCVILCSLVFRPRLHYAQLVLPIPAISRIIQACHPERSEGSPLPPRRPRFFAALSSDTTPTPSQNNPGSAGFP